MFLVGILIKKTQIRYSNAPKQRIEQIKQRFVFVKLRFGKLKRCFIPLKCKRKSAQNAV